eukprot:COSAG01_NODE_44207_length_421_cov_1.537267_1_plen_31_part_01
MILNLFVLLMSFFSCDWILQTFQPEAPPNSQ